MGCRCAHTSMHVCLCVCLCTSACEEVATEAWILFLKSLRQYPQQGFSEPDPAGPDLQDSGTCVSKSPAKGPSGATVADDMRVEGLVPLLRVQLCLFILLPGSPAACPGLGRESRPFQPPECQRRYRLRRRVTREASRAPGWRWRMGAAE